jgi:SAM-dependent methyltransferase
MRLCKVYSLADGQDADPLWQELLETMAPNWRARGALHRKYWEWGLGLYGLHKLGFVKPDAIGLSVGAGVEWPLYYLANRVQRVHAIDLYDPAHYGGLDPTIPENAAQLAPFPHRSEALLFQKMNALELQFPDNTFDFVFTFSSIEHFGGHPGAVLATQEIARVLKPGGVAAIATELMLNGTPHYEFFQPSEVEPCFVRGSGLELVEPLDLHIDAELISNPVPFEYPPGFQGDTGPHTSVRIGDLTFTSIELFLRKPQNWKCPPRPSLGATQARTRVRRLAQRATRYVPPVVRRAVKRLIRRPVPSP